VASLSPATIFFQGRGQEESTIRLGHKVDDPHNGVWNHRTVDVRKELPPVIKVFIPYLVRNAIGVDAEDNQVLSPTKESVGDRNNLVWPGAVNEAL